jgi:hypothetical protein
LLAHAFLATGDNLQARALEAGVATALVVPPNVWGSRCYAAAEARARAASAGLWSLARYAPIEASELDPDTRGFRLLRGQVRRVGESRGNWWLDLDPAVSLRLPKSDLSWFGDLDPGDLLGRRVEARGWVQRRRGQLRVTVRHPAALRPLD